LAQDVAAQSPAEIGELLAGLHRFVPGDRPRSALREGIVDIEQRLHRNGRQPGPAGTGALGMAQRNRAADGLPEDGRLVVRVALWGSLAHGARLSAGPRG